MLKRYESASTETRSDGLVLEFWWLSRYAHRLFGGFGMLLNAPGPGETESEE